MFDDPRLLKPRCALTTADLAHVFDDDDVEMLVRAAMIGDTINRIKTIDELTLMLRLKHPQLFIPLAADGYPLQRKRFNGPHS